MKRIAIAALLLAAGAAPAAHAARPNLKATHVSPPPGSVAELGKFKVTDSVRNAGRARAGRSHVRYYLTRDPAASLRERAESRSNPRTALGDILLEGARAVPALAARRTSSARRPVTVRVPVGTLAGRYYLLACADDRGAVAESDEADNCVASRRAAGVSELPGPDLDTTTFMDWERDGSDQEEADELALTRSYACTPTPGGSRPVRAAKAIASIERHLRARAPQGMAEFRRSADYRDAGRAEAAAATALVEGQPGAALAALARAHRLEPREASHLVGAAALATSIGLPREALGLLDQAARLDDRVPSAWGLNRQAVALANRASALMAVGQYRQAEAAAEAARALEPALAEASATASTAALCQDKVPVAVVKRKQSRRRTPPGTPPTGPKVDIEHGFEHPLRKLELPGFPPQSPRLLELYKAQQQERIAVNQRRNARQAELEAILRNKDVHPLERRQGGRLLSAVYRAHLEPELEAKDAEISKLLTEITDYRETFFCADNACSPERTEYTRFMKESNGICAGSNEDYSECYRREMRERCRPALKSWHQGWLGKMEDLYAKASAYHRAHSRLMSAIAAHIKDPDRHALALLQIEDLEDGMYFLVQQQAFFWTHDSNMRRDDCIEAPEPPAPMEDERPVAARGQSCPDPLKSVNALLDIGPVQLKISCEQVQLAGNGPGWIRAFGEVTYDFRANKITVFAGAQAEIGAGPLKADFKSGLYITVDNQGVQDTGWRMGPSYTVGAGPVEFNPSEMVDVSFVGIFSGP